MRVGRVSASLLLLFAAGSASAACQFGKSFGREPSLQSVFDKLFGGPVVSATNDCLAPDKTWSAPSQMSATIMIELAGFASRN